MIARLDRESVLAADEKIILTFRQFYHIRDRRPIEEAGEARAA